MILTPNGNLMWLPWQWHSLDMAGYHAEPNGLHVAMAHLVDHLILEDLVYLPQFYCVTFF